MAHWAGDSIMCETLQPTNWLVSVETQTGRLVCHHVLQVPLIIASRSAQCWPNVSDAGPTLINISQITQMHGHNTTFCQFTFGMITYPFCRRKCIITWIIKDRICEKRHVSLFINKMAMLHLCFICQEMHI